MRGYRKDIERIFQRNRVDLITFTSSSTVNHFIHLYEEKGGLKNPLAGVAIAAIAAMAGLINNVRPVGEPWRPLKFRLEVLALISLPES